MTTSNGRYIFQTASFQCGCVYRTVADTLVFCPVHRQDWHRGAITGTETLELPGPETPEIEGLVMSPYGKDRPEVYRNTDNNSIHTRVQTFDGRQEEWDEHQAEELGLCPACLIDNVDRHETGIAMCECGSDRLQLPVVREHPGTPRLLAAPRPGKGQGGHRNPRPGHLLARTMRTA